MNDQRCPDCGDRGFVRDWYADTESGYRACSRPGCSVAEEIAAAVDAELAQEAS